MWKYGRFDEENQMFKGLGAFCSREEMERMFEESFGVLWKQMENGLFME